jgi:hypothetical protein
MASFLARGADARTVRVRLEASVAWFADGSRLDAP